ncbi:MAG: hypothetical protein NWE89_11200 [Candidatus Bathyarchaeota archaeon]|nr:hypothetical protein [Candidatus Bathyarchaeota archaeon]
MSGNGKTSIPMDKGGKPKNGSESELILTEDECLEAFFSPIDGAKKPCKTRKKNESDNLREMYKHNY